MGVDPWELAGLPESKDTIFWYEWATASENAEIEAENARQKQAEERARNRPPGRR